MLNKLAFRNAKRSMKDYIIYIITMIAVSAMMFAFNSLIFSEDIQNMCSEAGVLAAMLGMFTFFIILIVAWLINYMTKFMLEKRSREFATYLLIGIKKKELSKLYMKENLLIGIAALFFGLIIGTLLQQIIMTVFYSVFSKEYKLHIQMNGWCIFMTVCCYLSCYLLALTKNRRTFRKMSIAELLQMEKKNDEIKYRHEKLLQYLFFIAVLYILFVYFMMVHGCTIVTAMLLIIGFIFAVYAMFSGISAFIVCRVQKKGKYIYQKNRIFLYRQLASKIRTMRFTMGTLTILLVFSLLGTSISVMFAKHQTQVVDSCIPFDILIYSPETKDDFSEEISAIKSHNKIKEQKIYHIYRNENQTMNRYFSEHISTTVEEHFDSEGNFISDQEYYKYDTYMKLSDYNELIKMLGKNEIILDKNKYALQTKPRIMRDLGNDIYNLNIEILNQKLSLSKVYTVPFSQNGINGADYLIILPDNICDKMQAYYSVYVANIEGEGTKKLRDNIYEVYSHKHNLMTYDEYETAVEAGKIKEEDWKDYLLKSCGTDQILVMASDFFVYDVDANEMKFVIASLTFSLTYIALIFIFASLTILSVQQLSDSDKYKFRYDVLKKLGMSMKEVDKVVFSQLVLFYLVPAVAAIAISSVIAIYAGNQFVKYTGAYGSGMYYFGISLLISAGVYILYFAATYVSFKRNINSM